MGTVGGASPGKLKSAVRVMVYHPRWSLPCVVCEAYQFTEHGDFRRTAGGEIEERGGLPTPCHKCPKVPKWARDEFPDDWRRLRTLADEATPANRKFIDFYRQMKAVNWNHPAAADPLVLYFSGAAREVEDQHARDAATSTQETFTAVLTLLTRKKWG